MKRLTALSVSFLAFGMLFGLVAAQSTQTATTASTHRKKKKKAAVKTAAVRPAAATSGTSRPVTAAKATARRKKVWAQTWDEPTYKDSAAGDKADADDPQIRKAAVDALGPYNGSVVVVDPNTGRVLTVVNQLLALGGGFQPCSTIKVMTALAGLREGVVGRLQPVRFYSRRSMDLTDALAFSNNYYFGSLGVKLGYERVNYYAHLFGYGEKAGLNIEGEHPGYFPPAPPKNGGMMMLTSFGEEIAQTPLEYAAIIASVANGGTLYWLQYPQTREETRDFKPEVKRHLDIKQYIPDVKPGMKGAVDFGTAKRARQDEELLGKTGTCSEGRTHLGWIGAFNEGSRKLAIVVMLTGGAPSIGATASQVAGDFYRELESENYFKSGPVLTPAALLPIR
ncbi:MAG: penicillin-binding protein [Acidobacteriota bacterium]|nr:penicillin-binding protein [Acidobacteriota bacterium]